MTGIAYNKGTKRERKEKKKMTREEKMARIEELEYKMFIEQMADFMNWTIYNRLQEERDRLKAELKAEGGD